MPPTDRRLPPAVPLLAAATLAVLLAGCDRHSADNTLNGIAADTNAAADRLANRVAEKTETVVDQAADKVEAAADNAQVKAQAALDQAKPKAKALADKAASGFDKLADATGNAAIDAGHAVAKAGRKTIHDADRATENARERDSDKE
jgi:hypothetical protein